MLRSLLVAFSILAYGVSPAGAKRVALVIGNQTYELAVGASAQSRSTRMATNSGVQRLTNLANPVADAKAIAAMLRALGYDEVLEFHDLDNSGFQRALRDYRRAAEGSAEVLVFYAGHGLTTRVKGKDANILAPTDAEIDCTHKEDPLFAVTMEDFVAAAADVPKQVYIFDACRENPFRACPARNSTRGSGFRAALQISSSTQKSIIVAYSTSEDGLAKDGPEGGNSPFAKALLSEFTAHPNHVFRELLEMTSHQVARETQNFQIPNVVSLGGAPDTCPSGKGCLTTAALLKEVKVTSDNLRVREAHMRAFAAGTFNRDDRPIEAALMALEGLPDDTEPATAGLPLVPELSTELARSVHSLRETGAIRERLVLGHGGPVYEAAFSPDGSRVVTASGKSARLWNAATGQPVAAFDGHTDDVISVAFSRDGSRIVTASRDKTARLWDINGTAGPILTGHTGRVFSAAFSDDGRRVVTTSSDNTARVWDVAKGTMILELRGHEDLINSAVFSRDGQRVVTGSQDRTVRIWNTDTGGEIAVMRGHGTSVTSVAFSPDGRSIASSSYDRTVRIWDTATNAQVGMLNGHRYTVNSVAFDGEGRRILTSSDDHTVRLWDAVTRTEIVALRGHDGRVFGAAFSGDGHRIVTASEDGTARVWDGAPADGLAVLRGHGGWVDGAAWSPDGKRIVTASWDNTVRAWDAITGAEAMVLKGHRGGVLSAAFSPDGRLIATGSRDTTARLWDAASGVMIRSFEGHAGPITSAAFSPDGRIVATASNDRTARLWTTSTGAEVIRIQGHQDVVTSAAFSPDGRHVVTTSTDGTARLWNTASGANVLNLKAQTGYFVSAVFSPDGSRVATVESDRLRFLDVSRANFPQIHTVRLWNVVTGAELSAFGNHDGAVQSVAFSPDGRRMVTGAADRSVRIWDAATGTEIVRLTNHAGEVSSVAFSPDGRRIVSASRDGTARIWDATLEIAQDQIDLAKRLVPRCLTEIERDRIYIAGKPPRAAWCDTLRKWPYDGSTTAEPKR